MMRLRTARSAPGEPCGLEPAGSATAVSRTWSVRAAAIVGLSALIAVNLAMSAVDAARALAGAPEAVAALVLGGARTVGLGLALALVTGSRTTAMHASIMWLSLVGNAVVAAALGLLRGDAHTPVIALTATAMGAVVVLPWSPRWQTSLAVAVVVVLGCYVVAGGAASTLLLTVGAATILASPILAVPMNRMRVELGWYERRSAEARRQAEAQARDLQSLVAVRTGELAAAEEDFEHLCRAVSHDLRPPLRTIASFAQLVREPAEATAASGSGETVGPSALAALDAVGELASAMARSLDELLDSVRDMHLRVADDLVSLSDVARAELAGAAGASMHWSIQDHVYAGRPALVLADLLRAVARWIVARSRAVPGVSVDFACRYVEERPVFRLDVRGLHTAASELARLRECLEGSPPLSTVAATLAPVLSAARPLLHDHGGAAGIDEERDGSVSIWFAPARSAAARPEPGAALPMPTHLEQPRRMLERGRLVLGLLLVLSALASALDLVGDVSSRAAVFWIGAARTAVLGAGLALLFSPLAHAVARSVTAVGVTALLLATLSLGVLRPALDVSLVAASCLSIVAGAYIPWGWRWQTAMVLATWVATVVALAAADGPAVGAAALTLAAACQAVSIWFAIRAQRVFEGMEAYIVAIEGARRESERLQRELELRVRRRTELLREAAQVLEGACRSLARSQGPSLARVRTLLASLESVDAAFASPHSRQLLERMRRAAGRIEASLAALLDYVELTQVPIARSPVDISALARTCLDTARLRDSPRRREFTVEEGIVLEGDPVLLAEVVEQLLDNALKATAQRDPAIVEVAALREEGALRGFVVRDNGIGFDMAYLAKLFLPFERLEDEPDGEVGGMGLARVRRILALHGASVSAYGTVGAGAELRCLWNGGAHDRGGDGAFGSSGDSRHTPAP